jgi:hypothetical protein
MSPLIVSCMSDSRIGRANTITIGNIYSNMLNTTPVLLVSSTGFIMYIIGYTFMTLFANEHVHDCWCPKSNNDTHTGRTHLSNEMCVEYILPALILT